MGLYVGEGGRHVSHEDLSNFFLKLGMGEGRELQPASCETENDVTKHFYQCTATHFRVKLPPCEWVRSQKRIG